MKKGQANAERAGSKHRKARKQAAESRAETPTKGADGDGSKPGFHLEEDENLRRESNIQVTPYDVFLEAHGKKPGTQATTKTVPPGETAGWVPADGATDGAAAGAPTDGLGDHRFGLRLGTHEQGGFMSKLRSRFKKGEPPVDMEALRQQEFAEAQAERIEPDERYKLVEVYPIRPPYGEVRILFDDETKEYIYQPLEPILTKTEKDILKFIEDTLVDTLTIAPEDLVNTDERQFVTDRFNDVIFDYSIILHEDEEKEDEIKRRLLYYVIRNFIGHGPIDLVMEDPYIEDVSCDGPHVPIFLYHRKYESIRSTVRFGEHDILDAFVIRMAQRSGKHISIAEPILDATLPDGSRLQETLSKEVSAGGSTFTIRKFRPDPFTPPDLVLFRTMSAEMLAYLWTAVQHGSSILYSGGTASGKTTSLNAILLFIPPQMKIVSIEDTREVNLPHENWIAGITRHGFGPRDQFGRQAGEIDMFQLLKNALRQRPEYIIVGEVRGQEAYSLFQAMATGHAAYGTMHADSVDAVIHRLESDPINVPRNLLEALDIVSVQIQTRVGGKRVRRTKQISEIVGIDPHTREILTNEVFRWVPKDDSFKFSGISYILERIQLEKALPDGSMLRELKRRAMIIEWMIEKKIQDYREVSKIVSAYYREPELVVALVQGQLADEDIPPGLREIAHRDAREVELDPLSAAALEQSKTVFGSETTQEDAKEPAQEEPAQEEPPLEAAQAEAGDSEGNPEHSSSPAPLRATRSRPDLSTGGGWESPAAESEQETEDEKSAGWAQEERKAADEDGVKADMAAAEDAWNGAGTPQSETENPQEHAAGGSTSWDVLPETESEEAEAPTPDTPRWPGAGALLEAAQDDAELRARGDMTGAGKPSGRSAAATVHDESPAAKQAALERRLEDLVDEALAGRNTPKTAEAEDLVSDLEKEARAKHEQDEEEKAKRRGRRREDRGGED